MREEGTPDVGEALFRRPQDRQVRSQLLEPLLLVTLHVTVGGGFVVGAPLVRRIATFAFYTLLPPVGTILLHKLRAVALEVAGNLTVMALVAAWRSAHRRSTPRNGRRRRLPGQVVDVEVDCGLLICSRLKERSL